LVLLNRIYAEESSKYHKWKLRYVSIAVSTSSRDFRNVPRDRNKISFSLHTFGYPIRRLARNFSVHSSYMQWNLEIIVSLEGHSGHEIMTVGHVVKCDSTKSAQYMKIDDPRSK
jgi:hypothetical protein